MSSVSELFVLCVRDAPLAGVRYSFYVLVKSTLRGLQRRSLPFLPSPLKLFRGNFDIKGILHSVNIDNITITNECDILKRAELTDKCYRTALKLDYYDSSLWIEFGVFCYGIHGFCSRLLKQVSYYRTRYIRKNSALDIRRICEKHVISSSHFEVLFFFFFFFL